MARNLKISELSARWLVPGDDCLNLLKSKGLHVVSYAYNVGDGWAFDVPETSVALAEACHWKAIARLRRREQQRQLAIEQLLLDL